MRIRSLLVAVAAALLVSSVPAVAARPTIGPPTVAYQVSELRGPGVRGAGFMDYTDDDCISCDLKVIAGLAPNAAYRVAGSPDACGVPFVKATRIYSYPITASARGTYWSRGRSVTLRSSTRIASVRVLKGTAGTAEAACGITIDLTDQTGHPLADDPAMLAIFDGAHRKGIIFGVEQPGPATALTAVFVDIPGDGPLRLRATTGTCSMTGVAAFTRALDVTRRHTAARTETVDNNETLSVADLGAIQLGAASAPFTRVACRSVIRAATIQG